MSDTICVEYDLPHPPAKVWRALTEPALLAAWLMENDIQPVVGHEFTLKAQPMPGWDGIVRCKVLEVDEPRRLRYSWVGGGERLRIDTVVTWTLTPTASGGTRLALEHSGFTAANAMAFEGLARGWRGKVAERISAALAAAA
jgi:uncharacterized protein YndB with AHSA1/START domain